MQLDTIGPVRPPSSGRKQVQMGETLDGWVSDSCVGPCHQSRDGATGTAGVQDKELAQHSDLMESMRS